MRSTSVQFPVTSTDGAARKRTQRDARCLRRAVAGGTQSLHTNGFDEALALPTERSARIALRTQQVLAHESGVADTVDPFAGSYFIESLTDEIEERSWELMKKVEDLGGSVNALEFMQREIEESSSSYHERYRTGARCRALILAAQGRVEDAERAVEHTLVEHERLPLGIERARSLLVLGRIRRRLRKRRAAKEALDEALQIFEWAGSPRWAAQARDEIDAIGLRSKAEGDALTPAEARVAGSSPAGCGTRRWPPPSWSARRRSRRISAAPAGSSESAAAPSSAR